MVSWLQCAQLKSILIFLKKVGKKDIEKYLAISATFCKLSVANERVNMIISLNSGLLLNDNVINKPVV